MKESLAPEKLNPLILKSGKLKVELEVKRSAGKPQKLQTYYRSKRFWCHAILSV
jgi:hypothetical protein